MRQSRDQFQAERLGFVDNRPLYLVELLVQFHGPANVFDIFHPAQVCARHVGRVVFPAGGDNQLVERKLFLAGVDHPLVHINPGDDGAGAHVKPHFSVKIGRLQEQAVKLFNLAPKDVGDAARTVGNIFKFSQQGDA